MQADHELLTGSDYIAEVSAENGLICWRWKVSKRSAVI